MRTSLTVSVMVALTSFAVVPISSAPAQASDAGCATEIMVFALNPYNSDVTLATSKCDGFYAEAANTHADYVRGQYFVNEDSGPARWVQSSLGWQYIGKSWGTGKKIVGNTITGRALRGEGQHYKQTVIAAH